MKDPEGVLADEMTNFPAVLDVIDDLFYMFDTEQRLVAWNRPFAEVTGYTDDELLGMSPSEFIREQDQEELNSYLEQIGETGSGTLQVELLTKRGMTIPYEFYSDSLTNDNGDLLGRVGVGRDTTERVEHKRALERENERLHEFASTLVHDLRNPLNVAQAHVEMLPTERASETDETPHRDAITESLDRIERIISDVLELARTGELVTEQEQVNLGELARDVWEDVERGQARLTVENDLSIRADSSLLERLLTNLLRNTIEHGGTDVAVRIGALPEEKGFYVEDNGPGISPAERNRIFDWKHTTKTGGFGVGLKSVQRTCDAHDWDISVTDSEGGGAQFEISGVEIAE